MNALKNVLGCFACALVLTPLSAEAGALTIVNVNSPAINCVFNPSCTVTVNDSVGTIPIPGVGGTARLQSRTYVGVPGAPAAGKTAYVYRVDLTQAKSTALAAVNCVSKLILDFGPVTKLPYGPVPSLTHVSPNVPADVFVITSGGIGTIGLSSAVQSGNIIRFTFSTPVCPGVPTAAAVVNGKSSFFFGLAAATAPKPTMAHVMLSLGGSANTAARVPKH